MDNLGFPTKPVDQIVGAATLAAFSAIENGTGRIIERGSISLRGSLDTAIGSLPRGSIFGNYSLSLDLHDQASFLQRK